MAYSKDLRPEEIIRIVILAIIFGFLMVVQRLCFSTGVIELGFSDTETQEIWLRQSFNPVAIIVLLDSVFFAVIWYFTALSSNKNYEPQQERLLLVKWLGFFLTTLIINLCVAMSLYGQEDASPQALLWFLILFLINTVLIYWTSTAISTPGLLAYVVPGSTSLRKLFRIDK